VRAKRARLATAATWCAKGMAAETGSPKRQVFPDPDDVQRGDDHRGEREGHVAIADLALVRGSDADEGQPLDEPVGDLGRYMHPGIVYGLGTASTLASRSGSSARPWWLMTGAP
jgi:hypothetical protein